MRKVSVLVAGSWGTALAAVLAQNNHAVTLWSRQAQQVAEINTMHENKAYLPGVTLPTNLRATDSLELALEGAEAVVIAAPSSAMRQLIKQVEPLLAEHTIVVHAAKGFEMETLKRMSTVIAEELPQYDSRRIVVLSGPSHAEEVVQNCPTTVVVAAEDLEAAEKVQDLMINQTFRVYTNPDPIGVEVSGALKNIIAIGAGLSDGLGFGDNAKAALLTRGLAEISRLGVAMGAQPLTFAGLAGFGDLVVTCTSKHSRNWRCGYLLAQGYKLDEVLAQMGMVVEGIRTTKAAHMLASKYDVQMPITEQLHEVLFANKAPAEAVRDLMGRMRTHEMEEAAIFPPGNH